MRDAIYLVPFYDVILPIDHVSLTLNGATSFFRVKNVRNTCKRLHYSHTVGEISSVQRRKRPGGLLIYSLFYFIVFFYFFYFFFFFW